MAGAEHMQQRLLKAQRRRPSVRKMKSPSPAHLPSPQLPSSIATPSPWPSPSSPSVRFPHAPIASTHHVSYTTTALDLPNLLEASLMQKQSTCPPLAAPKRLREQPSVHDAIADEIAGERNCTTASGDLDLTSIADRPCAERLRSDAAQAASQVPGSQGPEQAPQMQLMGSITRAELRSLTSLLESKPKSSTVLRHPVSGRHPTTPSPKGVASLSRAFRVTEEKAQVLATNRPALLAFTEDQVAQRAEEICTLLQVKETQALLAIRKQPFLLQTDMATLRGRLEDLQRQLGLGMELTCRLCANAPSVLKRPADKLGERFERLAQSLAMTKAEVVDMSGRCSHTQFLTERSKKLQARFEALMETLHLDAIQTAKVVRRQPDILFMSSRILANKMRVLQAVFSTKHRMVTPLVAKCPEVLRRDMNSIRRIVCMLQVMLNLAPDFVYKMMAYNARLLSMNFQSTQWKAAQLRDAANSCTCWAEQWQSMVPKRMEHCLSATQASYYRLHYIMQTGQQERVKLVDVLRLPMAKFQLGFPEYNAWLQQQQLRQQLQQ